MNVHDYGEVLLCRDITFEDNKLDMEYAHPGIVLLPTDYNNDEIYCLYMTSNSNRATREQEKYIKNYARAVKESFINIQQIVKRSNKIEPPKTVLDDERFEEVLKSFYKYQISLVPQKKEFLEIKSHVEALLNVLQFNKEFEIEDNIIDRKQLDVLSQIPDKDKQRVIYAISILKSDNLESKRAKENNFINERQKEYFNRVIKTYDDISEINFDKLKLEETNNPLRDIYFNIRNNNFLLNINALFNDVATIFEFQGSNNLEKSKKIKEFIKNEQNLELKRAMKKEVKKTEKDAKNVQKNKDKTKQRHQNKLKRDKNKYGNFDANFFDYE